MLEGFIIPPTINDNKLENRFPHPPGRCPLRWTPLLEVDEWSRIEGSNAHSIPTEPCLIGSRTGLHCILDWSPAAKRSGIRSRNPQNETFTSPPERWYGGYAVQPASRVLPPESAVQPHWSPNSRRSVIGSWTPSMWQLMERREYSLEPSAMY